MPFPCETVEGETVTVTQKVIEQGDDIINSVLLTTEDGRRFRPAPNGLKIVEILDGEEAPEAPEEPPAPPADEEDED
jgi:hypothetical protein